MEENKDPHGSNYKKVVVGKKRRKRINEGKTRGTGMSLLGAVDIPKIKGVIIDKGGTYKNIVRTIENYHLYSSN